MTHRACQAILLELAYGEISKRKSARALAHMAECEDCRSEYERLGATRRAMQSLGRVEPSVANERILLAAARQAAQERTVSRLRFVLPSWVWKASLTTALVLVVGGVSFQLLSIREGKMQLAPASAPATAPKPVAPMASAAAPAVDAPEGKLNGLAAVGPKKERAAPFASAKAGERARGLVDSVGTKEGGRREAKQAPASVETLERLTNEIRESEKPAPPAAPAEPETVPRPSLKAAAPAKKGPSRGEEDFAANEGPSAGAASSASQALDSRSDRKAEPSPKDKMDLATHVDSRVQAVKDLADGIERQRLARRLAESVRALETCAGSSETERRIYRDGTGRIVKYARRSGSGNIEVTSEFYYDGTGELRLALVSRTGPGGSVDTRTYFDERGRRFHEERSSERASSGKGAGEGSEQELVRNPESAFSRSAACP